MSKHIWHGIHEAIRPNENVACVLDTIYGYEIGYYYEDQEHFHVDGEVYPDKWITRFAVINDIESEE